MLYTVLSSNKHAAQPDLIITHVVFFWTQTLHVQSLSLGTLVQRSSLVMVQLKFFLLAIVNNSLWSIPYKLCLSAVVILSAGFHLFLRVLIVVWI